MDQAESNQINSAGQGSSLKQATRPPSRLDQIGGDHIGSKGWYEAGLLNDQREYDVVRMLRSTHASLHDGFSAIREALLVRDPQITPEAHLVAVQKKGKAWLNEVIGKTTEAKQRADVEEATLNTVIKSKLGTPTHHAAEVRAYLRSLNDDQRAGALETAANEGDTVTMAAMLDAPAYLSGMEAREQEAFRKLYLERNAADLLRKREAVQLARDINEKALQEADAGLREFFDPKIVGNIIAASERAAVARDAIDKSLA